MARGYQGLSFGLYCKHTKGEAQLFLHGGDSYENKLHFCLLINEDGKNLEQIDFEDLPVDSMQDFIDFMQFRLNQELERQKEK